MKQHSSAPTLLWYAPAMAGISYLLVFTLFITLAKTPENEQIGDFIFSTGQVFILLSMLLLHKLNLNGRGFWKKVSLLIPALGSLSYLAGIISLHTGNPMIIFFPTGALLIGVGMLIVGIQVAKAGELKQWKRFTPLLVGVYPFVVMFPIVIVTGSTSLIAIMLWGIAWKIMGCTLLSELYNRKKYLV